MTELMITSSRILINESGRSVKELATLTFSGRQDWKNLLSCLSKVKCGEVVSIELNSAYSSEAPVSFPPISIPTFRYMNATTPTEIIATKISGWMV